MILNPYMIFCCFFLSSQFYRATVQFVCPSGLKYHVNFTDYGNTEEVGISDIRAVPKEVWVSKCGFCNCDSLHISSQ